MLGLIYIFYLKARWPPSFVELLYPYDSNSYVLNQVFKRMQQISFSDIAGEIRPIVRPLSQFESTFVNINGA